MTKCDISRRTAKGIYNREEGGCRVLNGKSTKSTEEKVSRR